MVVLLKVLEPPGLRIFGGVASYRCRPNHVPFFVHFDSLKAQLGLGDFRFLLNVSELSVASSGLASALAWTRLTVSQNLGRIQGRRSASRLALIFVPCKVFCLLLVVRVGLQLTFEIFQQARRVLFMLEAFG